MNAIRSAINVFLLVLAVIAALFAFTFVQFAWTNSGLTIAANECRMRRIELKIDDAVVGSHQEACLGSKGYRRLSACEFSPVYESHQSCFVPTWQFWR